MAVRTEDGRIGRIDSQGTVEVPGEVEPGQGLQADVLNRITVPRQRRGKLRIQGRPGRQRFQPRADHDPGSQLVRPRHPLFKRGEFGGSLLLVEAAELLTPPLGGEEQEKSPQEYCNPEAASTRRHSLSMMQQAVTHGKKWVLAVRRRIFGVARQWSRTERLGSPWPMSKLAVTRLTARGKSRHGIRPSLHPGGLRCYGRTYSRYAPESRLVRRAQERSRCSRDFRHGLLRTNGARTP